MKIKLEKRTQYAGGICLILGMIVVLVLLIRTGTDKDVDVVSDSVLDYQYQTNAAYEVHLIQNDYFDEDVRPMDENYIRNLVDFVKINLSASYHGNDRVQAQGEYWIKILLRGYQLDEGEKSIIWEKNMGTLDHQQISGEIGEYQIAKEASVNINDYAQAGQQAMNELGINSNCEVVAILTGNITVEKDGQTASIPLDSYVEIPITDGLFTIERTEDANVADALKQQTTVSAGVAKGKMAALTFVLLAFALLLFLLWKKTEYYNEDDRNRKKLQMILRTYRSRMTALSEIPDIEWREIYEVAEIPELLKVADELRRPVFYIRDKDTLVKYSCFFVLDGGCQYICIGK